MAVLKAFAAAQDAATITECSHCRVSSSSYCSAYRLLFVYHSCIAVIIYKCCGFEISNPSRQRRGVAEEKKKGTNRAG